MTTDATGSSTLRFEPQPYPTASGITALLEVMRDKYANGGILFRQFRVVGDPRFTQLAQYGSLNDLDFLNQLLGSDALQQTTPELTNIYPIEQPIQWSATPLQLANSLAQLISQGGAYSYEHPSAAHAQQLADDFVQSLPGGRSESVSCWFITYNWSDWFCDAAWDYTLVTYDSACSLATVLCLTDTD